MIWKIFCNGINALLKFHRGIVLSWRRMLISFILCNHLFFCHFLSFFSKILPGKIFKLELGGWTRFVTMGNNDLNPKIAKWTVTVCTCPACIKYVLYVVSFMIFMKTESKSIVREWRQSSVVGWKPFTL